MPWRHIKHKAFWLTLVCSSGIVAAATGLIIDHARLDDTRITVGNHAEAIDCLEKITVENKIRIDATVIKLNDMCTNIRENNVQTIAEIRTNRKLIIECIKDSKGN